MKYLLILIIILSIYEIRPLIKKKQIKVIILFSIIAFLTLGLGYIYFSNPNEVSLSRYILSTCGQDI